jgi:hypothetical protein
MDLARRISVVAAKSAVGTHDLQENVLITIIGAKTFFKSEVLLLLKTDNDGAVLCLNNEYCAVITDKDITDINIRKCNFFIIYKKQLRMQ